MIIKNTPNRFSCTFFIWMILVLNACTEAPKKSPIITDIKCAPPCWQNITPGYTKETELVEILGTLNFIEPNSIVSSGSRYIYSKEYSFRIRSTEIIGRIEFLKDVVTTISFFSGDNHDPWIGITFEESIEAFGDPEFIINVKTSGPRKFLWFYYGHYGKWRYIYAINIQRGLEFGFKDFMENKNPEREIDPTKKITTIMFFDPIAFQTLTNAKDFGVRWDYEELLERMQPWVGYGIIDELYPYIP